MTRLGPGTLTVLVDGKPVGETYRVLEMDVETSDTEVSSEFVGVPKKRMDMTLTMSLTSIDRTALPKRSEPRLATPYPREAQWKREKKGYRP